MSVILGLKTDSVIIVAGDKRGTGLNGGHVDNLNKLIEVNDNLVFASAGNAALERFMEIELNKNTYRKLITVDDLCKIAVRAYDDIKEPISKLNVSDLCYCLIAGTTKDGLKMFGGDTNSGRMKLIETTNLLVPPPDVQIEKANEIYARNYHLHFSEFAERTIREISAQSKFVSPTGDKWFYDIESRKGRLSTF